jgi:hypothetical protein
MDRSTARDPGSATSWPKLAFWAVALGVGAYLGYAIRFNFDTTTIASVNVIIAGFLAVAILAVLAVFAILARGRPASRAATVAGVLLVVGVGIGWAITSVLGLKAP